MPIPTFTPNLPVGTQTLGNTVVQINNNFGNYNGLITVNHGTPNSSNQGKHLFVEMPVQSPAPTTLSGEGGLFTQSVSGSSELFYQRDGVGTNYQLTGPSSFSPNGYIPLFGGMILQWGGIGVNTTGVNVTFPKAFPNNVFGVTLGPVVNPPLIGTFVALTATPSLTGFPIKTTAGAFLVYWFAIGN